MPPPADPSARSAATGANSTAATIAVPNLLRHGRLVARAPVGDPHPSELRRLVLDYLCHQCFVGTAIALAKDERPRTQDDERGGRKGAGVKGGKGREGGEGKGATRDYLGEVISRALGEGKERSVRFETDAHGDAEMGDAMELEAEGGPKAAVNGVATDGVAANEHSERVDEEAGYPELSKEDIERTRWRLEIRNHIVEGRIKEAISAIEAHFPSVLDNTAATPPPSTTGPSNPDAGSSGSLLKPSGDISRPSSRISFSTSTSSVNLLRPLSGPNPRSPLLRASTSSTGTTASGTGGPSPGAIVDRPHAMFASLEPPHVALNLQTQAFIEFVRSTASGAAPSSATSNGVLGGSRPETPAMASPKRPHADLATSTGSLDGGAAGSPAASMTSSSTTNSAVSQKTAALALSLSYCQALWRRAANLPDPSERVVFLKELESVSALLSYPDPWASPARRYMEQTRRDALAERVNAAILVSLGRSPTPVLELVAQQTTFMWNTLHEFETKLTGHLPGRTNVRHVPDKVCPPFHFDEFVDEPVVADDSPRHGLQALLS